MTTVSGVTSNGCAYEGDYERSGNQRVTWTATYRRSGVFFGMRHGRISGMMECSAADIDRAVKADIEEAWVRERNP